MSIEIRVVDDPAQACADALSDAAASGENVVLTGGSTPRQAYELAAARRPQDWRDAKLWFSDDRCVEPADDLSNFKLVKSRCSTRLSSPAWRSGSAGGFSVSAATCRARSNTSASLSTSVRSGRDPLRAGAAGVGGDGISARCSRQESLSERSRMAVGVPERARAVRTAGDADLPGAEPRQARAGTRNRASKADPIAAAFADDAPRTTDVPASLLAEHVEEIVVLLDEEAARL